MPEGFQTQLSETFNKQRREGAPLLEAFLDANGRLAFRFEGEDGVPVAQPRVTTPGFVPPSLGTNSSASATTPSITPQASEVATGTVKGDVGGAGEVRGDVDQGFLSTQNAPMTDTQRGLASSLAGPFSFPVSLGLRGLQSLGAGVVGGGSPSPGTTQFQALTTEGDIAARQGFATHDEFSQPNPTFDFTLGDRTGFISGGDGGATASTPQGQIDVQTQVDTFSSMSALDNMSGIGTEGGGGDDRARDAADRERDDAQRDPGGTGFRG